MKTEQTADDSGVIHFSRPEVVPQPEEALKPDREKIAQWLKVFEEPPFTPELTSEEATEAFSAIKSMFLNFKLAANQQIERLK